MAADKLRKVGSSNAVPNVASVATGGRSVGVTTMTVDAGGLTGWATSTSVDFTTYRIVGNVATAKTDWTGRADPGTNTISDMEVTNGTDTGNLANDIVVCIETSAWINDLITTLLLLFNADGTKKADSIVSSMIIASAVSTVKIADLAVTTPKIADNNVLPAKLGLATAYTGGVASQANAGSAGGTIYYINLGGLKMAWGNTAAINIGGGTSLAYVITFPTSFFTTVQSFTASTAGATSSASQFNGVAGNSAVTPTGAQFYLISTPQTATGAGVSRVDWFAIGT